MSKLCRTSSSYRGVCTPVLPCKPLYPLMLSWVPTRYWWVGLPCSFRMIQIDLLLVRGRRLEVTAFRLSMPVPAEAYNMAWLVKPFHYIHRIE